MIFTTFGNAVIIQQEQLQNAQNTYQVKDKDHVNILSDFFSKFLLKKLEKFGVEKPIFSDGGGNPPPLVLKGLIWVKSFKKVHSKLCSISLGLGQLTSNYVKVFSGPFSKLLILN